MTEPRARGLKLRRLADRTDPASLTADLPGAPPGTWPLAGVELLDAPDCATVPVHVVDKGRDEGWITVEGEQVVHRPGGPPSNLWKVTHTFRHYDAVTISGVRYVVTHQPDKYADPGDDDAPVTDEVYASGSTRVDHFYVLVRD